MSELLAVRAVLEGIARDAGAIMLKYWGLTETEMGLRFKPDGSPVTFADIEGDELADRRVADELPEVGYIGEESSRFQPGQRRLVIVDSLDDTNGYIKGAETAAFSAAYTEDGVSLVGVAHNPFKDELFSAVYGMGATLNHVPIRVSNRRIAEAVFGGSNLPNTILANQPLYKDLESMGVTIKPVGGIVNKGCLIASGLMDGTIFRGNNAHDIAAVARLVEEAGGVWTDLAGNKQPYNERPINGAIIANSEETHAGLLAGVKKLDIRVLVR